MIKLSDLLKNSDNWLSEDDKSSDIVISSRIRLARNLKAYRFSPKANVDEKAEIEAKVGVALQEEPNFKGILELELFDLNPIERQFLVERYLISRDHAEADDKRSVIVSDKEQFSLMVNEEDHIRMQSYSVGLDLRKPWEALDVLDSRLSERLEFAYDRDFGHLTACPTNVGTGLRASVMMHLPCLVMTGQSTKIFEAISKLGMAIRGIYGEGTAASGNIFQISNQMTLGRNELEIIENLEDLVQQIIGHEQTVRQKLLEEKRLQIEDKIQRAYGILKHARVISFAETIELISALRLGYGLNLLHNKIDKKLINDLFLFSQPAHIQMLFGHQLSAGERDEYRADLIRKRLS